MTDEHLMAIAKFVRGLNQLTVDTGINLKEWGEGAIRFEVADTGETPSLHLKIIPRGDAVWARYEVESW